jgi:predicted nucleotidyltransferase
MDESALRAGAEVVRSRWPGVQVVYLFGSEARGGASAASDVDLAVVAPRSLAAYERFVLQEDLARALGRDVDLVDLRVASEALKVEVIRSGRVLFESSSAARGAFECEALADYLSHKERFAANYQDIAERGVAYG